MVHCVYSWADESVGDPLRYDEVNLLSSRTFENWRSDLECIFVSDRSASRCDPKHQQKTQRILSKF